VKPPALTRRRLAKEWNGPENFRGRLFSSNKSAVQSEAIRAGIFCRKRLTFGPAKNSLKPHWTREFPQPYPGRTNVILLRKKSTYEKEIHFTISLL